MAFYDKPYLKFERLLETYHGLCPPAGSRSFLAAMPVWIKEKLFMRTLLQRGTGQARPGQAPDPLPEHHLSHAASAFYPSPFQRGRHPDRGRGGGVGHHHHRLRRGQGPSPSCGSSHFPHSLGLLYSAFTYYCGFKVNSGEYKLMGLAPYGNADSAHTRRGAA